MKLREIYSYELEYRRRSASTWIYAGILFLIAMWMFLATADEDSAAYINSTVRLAGNSIIPGMFGMLITAALFGDAALRDVEVGMDPLLFTSPLRKSEYLGGRFLAALTVNAFLLVAIPLGQLAATALVASFGTETVGPFRVVAYLQPFLLFSLPNLVVVGAILFTIGMLARSVVPVYLCAIGIFIGTLVGLNYPGWTENPVLVALTDPLGIGTLQEMTRYWPVADQNTRLIGFPATLLLNRVVWLAVAGAALVVLHRRFRFAHQDGGQRRRERGEAVVEGETTRLGPVVVPRVTGSFDFRTSARQTLAVARNSLAEFMATRAFRVVMLACFGLTMLWGWNVGETRFDTPTWPVTMVVVEEVVSRRVEPLIYLLVVLYAGALVRKEREVGTGEIADASPVPESAALLGRFLAILAMIVMFQAVSLVGGILIQALQGYYKFEPGLYLTVVFGLNLPTYVILAALAMSIHVVVNHKYLGHIVVLMALIFPRVSPAFEIRHYLLRYGMDAGWTYSDMNGFGPFVAPFVWFKLYWAAWALLLGVIAVLLYVRGTERGWRERIAEARMRLTTGAVRAATVATVLIVTLGAFIFYNTNVLNEYWSPDEVDAAAAEYERTFGRYKDAPQPVIVDAKLRIEIDPEHGAVDLGGMYQMVNRTDTPIDSVHVIVHRNVEVRSLAVDRPAKLVVENDRRHLYRIYELERSLSPGDTLRLMFDHAFRRRGFPNRDINTSVVENGAYFDRNWLPRIGYQESFELSDEYERKKHGLPPRPALGLDDEKGKNQRFDSRDADLVSVDAMIGTAGDQIAVTPGVLRRSWTENGRRYFHYETEKPESFGVVTVSANSFASIRSHVLKRKTPPGLSTRRVSENALDFSGKNITPNWHTTASNSPSRNGSASASACRHLTGRAVPTAAAWSSMA